jgi:GrpB-like predicted nucleotidyltransferase (UPF0157 family)
MSKDKKPIDDILDMKLFEDDDFDELEDIFSMKLFDESEESDYLFEMANLHKSDSNLPVNLYFTCNGDVDITNHNNLRITSE